MNSDISPTEVSAVTVIDKDTVFYHSFNSFTYTLEYVMLLRVPYEEIDADK